LEKQGEALLGGYRVLDLTNERGHLCGKILGDLGADVIVIEPPGGCSSRNTGPFYHDIPEQEKSLFWWYANASKRGITLDLSTHDGKNIFLKLVKSAHFVVESFEPGYMEDLGLGYQDLEAINPGVVVTSITPFGRTGPHAGYQATDIVCSAMGGLMQLFGQPDRAPVRVSCDPQSYFLGGLHAAQGAMVAHYHRELTGEGQHVDVSIQQAVILTLMVAVEIWDLYKFNIRGNGPFARSITPKGLLSVRFIYACKDGHVVHWPGGGAQAGIVASTTRLIKWANDEGMCLEFKDYDWTQFDALSITQEDLDRVTGIIGQFLMTKTKTELLDKAVQESMLIAPVATIADIYASPQLQARGYWQEVEHPEIGETVKYPGAPVKLSGATWQIRCRAPLIGEHNREIYGGELGYSQEQLVLLKSRGVI
jgi:crotonobetainyl-CoA:carnitine CoA-transferase CaiB-like acyl-CoA transferase